MITVDWVCEFCFRAVKGSLPKDWDLVWQSAVCPECQKKVELDGGYFIVKGGAYAMAEDPRGDVKMKTPLRRREFQEAMKRLGR